MEQGGDSRHVEHQLQGVQSIHATRCAFATWDLPSEFHVFLLNLPDICWVFELSHPPSHKFQEVQAWSF